MSSRLVARQRATYDDAGSMRGPGGFRMSRMIRLINKWRNDNGAESRCWR